eukprot:437704-Prymnesium_polylepis.1
MPHARHTKAFASCAPRLGPLACPPGLRRLRHGAALNVQTSDGNSALMLAAYHGHVDVVQRLLQARARIDLKDSDGRTALALASRTGHSAIARLLHAIEVRIGSVQTLPVRSRYADVGLTHCTAACAPTDLGLARRGAAHAARAREARCGEGRRSVSDRLARGWRARRLNVRAGSGQR